MITSSPKIVGIIPARMGSSRFPGKPLAPILGIPMIEHVVHRVSMCKQLDEVYVATCDQEIAQAVTSFGGKAIMTSTEHTRASDRTAEAAQSLDAEIIVLVQGDEPMTTPQMIEAAIAPMLQDPTIGCVNLASRISSRSEFEDPNTIKVVLDSNGDALYFSRVPIPNTKQLSFEGSPKFKQVCIIPFRRAVLAAFAKLEPTPLELAESVDMMRFLEHGYSVRMVEHDVSSHAVDTQADLDMVQELLRNDPLTRSYLDERLAGVPAASPKNIAS